MNKARREALKKILETLENTKGEIEALRDEEQEYFDNMPESLQGGEKGTTAEDAVENMENTIGSIEDAISTMEESAI